MILFLFLFLALICNAFHFKSQPRRKPVYYTKRAYVKGYPQHGWNFYNNQSFFNFTELSDLNLSLAAKQYWSQLFVEEFSALDDNGDCQTITSDIDTSFEIGACLTESAHFLYLFDGFNVTDWLTEDQRIPRPIFKASVVPVSRSDDNRIERYNLSSYDDVLLGDAPKTTAFYSYPVSNAEITVDSINQVRCYMKMYCYDDGTGKFEVEMFRGLPQTPYSLWGAFGNSSWIEGDIYGSFMAGIAPFGGIPSIFMTNEYGYVFIKRKLPFCALDNRDPLMMVTLVAHWDFSVYGATYEGDGWAGINVANHCALPVARYVS